MENVLVMPNVAAVLVSTAIRQVIVAAIRVLRKYVERAPLRADQFKVAVRSRASVVTPGSTQGSVRVESLRLSGNCRGKYSLRNISYLSLAVS